MIHCQHVSKQLASTKVLDDVQLHIQKNRLVGITGRDGAGKTTLLKLIAGCWRPNNGEVTVFGEAPFDNLFVSANSILIDDAMELPEGLTLRELLHIFAHFYPNWDEGLAAMLLSHFQLEEGTRYSELYEGERSVFHLVIGLCSRAPLTIFDEPMTSMERTMREDFYHLLVNDYTEYPRTILLSSDFPDEVSFMLDEIILIEKGNVLFHLPLDDVRHYARGVRGSMHEVRSWAEGQTVLYEAQVGMNELFVVIKNDEHFVDAYNGSFTVTAVSVADLAAYLTREETGDLNDFTKTT